MSVSVEPGWTMSQGFEIHLGRTFSEPVGSIQEPRNRVLSGAEVPPHPDYDAALEHISSLLEKLLFAHSDDITAGWAERLLQNQS